MRSFDSPVSIKSVKGTILTICLFFTFFSTCNSNTLLTEDHVLTFVNVTLVRDDGLQKVAHKLFCLNFSDILSEIYIFSGLKVDTSCHLETHSKYNDSLSNSLCPRFNKKHYISFMFFPTLHYIYNHMFICRYICI